MREQEVETVNIPVAELKTLRDDARRYRWLKKFAISRSIKMDPGTSWYISESAIWQRGSTLESAIDTTILDSPMADLLEHEGGNTDDQE
jgi:hypothetical protein